MAYSLDHEHYADDSDDPTVPQRVKPKGRQLYGNIIHRAGQILAAPSTIDLIPGDEESSDDLVAVWKAKLEHYEADPANMVKPVERLTVIEALSSRLGAYRYDYSRETRRIEVSPVQGGMLRWADGYFSPHQRTCPWAYEVCRMETTEIEGKDGWKNTADLNGDEGLQAGSARGGTQSGGVDFGASRAPSLGDSTEKKFTTVVFLWRRVYGQASVEKPGSFTPLAPADHYMACMSQDQMGCGYSTPTVADMQSGEDMPPAVQATIGEDGTLPEQIPGGCPECGGDLQAITASVAEAAFPAKLHLTIFAPFEGEGRVFYADFDKYELPTIPYVVWTSYVRPGKPMGQSETSLNVSYQAASDLLSRMLLENMLIAAKPYVQIPETARDFKGEPWLFLPEQGLGIYVDPLTPASIQWVQATGMPAGLPNALTYFDNALRADFGTNDMTFGADQTRDIPVGTMQSMERIKEIPVADQIDSWRQAKSMGLLALLHMLRATELDAEPFPMNDPTGRRVIHTVAAADLPPMNVIVSADPSSAALVGETIDNEIKIASAPRPIRRLLARRNNIPMSQITQLEQDEDAEMMRQAEMQMQMAQMAMAGAPMQGGGMDGGAPAQGQPGNPAGAGAAMNGPGMMGA